MTEGDVRGALATVLDPELDEDLVELGFVDDVAVERGRVAVRLRLPTYWCSPNFSWLMAQDARAAVLGLPGVDEVEVTLADHHAGEEIAVGVNEGRSFGEVFGAEDDGTLRVLRRAFRRKAFQVRQDRLLRSLAAPRADVTVGELPDTDATRAYLAARSELGLDCDPRAPAICDPEGRPVSDLEAHRHRLRLVRVSVETNSAMCRGLLATRYGKVQTT